MGRSRALVQLARGRVVATACVVVLVAAGCSWGMVGYDAANTRRAPLGGSVRDLPGYALQWRSSSATGLLGPVVGEHAYNGSAAYDVHGEQGCVAGAPRVCGPEFTFAPSGVSIVDGSTAFGYTQGGTSTAPEAYAYDANGEASCDVDQVCHPVRTYAVGSNGYALEIVAHEGLLYLLVMPANTGTNAAKVVVFSADGSAGCAGVPVTCAPLWEAPQPAGFEFSQPPKGEHGRVMHMAVTGDGLYLVGSGGLLAFDEKGSQGCTGQPIVCSPLWAAPVPGGPNTDLGNVAVANGRVYTEDFQGTVRVFDALGAEGCSGTPATCSPVWTAVAGNEYQFGVVTSFAVDGDRLYTAHGYYGQKRLAVFDAKGQDGCAGTPRVCEPLWTAQATGTISVTNDVLVVDGLNGSAVGNSDPVRIFDARGNEGCSGTPKVCEPIWTSDAGVAASGRVVADRLFLSSWTGSGLELRMYATPPPPPPGSTLWG